MITSHLSTISMQIPLTPNLQTGLEFLQNKGWEGLPEGEFEVDGRAVWGLIQHYETLATPVKEFETHRLHIDIHYIVEGKETIHWIPAQHLSPEGSYDEKRDVWITELALSTEKVTSLQLREGEVAVFYPSDGHWPRRARRSSNHVKKVLIKVALNN